MNEEENIPLTELQLSQQTGVRCFLVSLEHFSNVSDAIEGQRNLDQIHTISSFRQLDAYPVSTSGEVMVKCRTNQITAADEVILIQAKDSGLIDEKTVDEFEALKPEEDEEEI